MPSMYAPAGLIRSFLESLGFDPEYVLEAKIEPDSVIVFHGDPITEKAHISKLPIMEVIVNEQS